MEECQQEGEDGREAARIGSDFIQGMYLQYVMVNGPVCRSHDSHMTLSLFIEVYGTVQVPADHLGCHGNSHHSNFHTNRGS